MTVRLLLDLLASQRFIGWFCLVLATRKILSAPNGDVNFLVRRATYECALSIDNYSQLCYIAILISEFDLETKP